MNDFVTIYLNGEPVQLMATTEEPTATKADFLQALVDCDFTISSKACIKTETVEYDLGKIREITLLIDDDGTQHVTIKTKRE